MTYETVFKECIEATVIRDYQKFMDEVNAQPEHVFSKRFEERMQKMMRVKKKKSKLYKFTRKIVAAAAIALITLGLMLTQQTSTEAGFWDVYFIDWLEEYFTMEQGDIVTEEVEFSLEQITYLPEGFELVEETSTYSKMYLDFSEGEKIVHVEVFNGATSKWGDSEEVRYNIARSEDGRIYFYLDNYQAEHKCIKFQVNTECYIQIFSNIELEELVKIMDGIIE